MDKVKAGLLVHRQKVEELRIKRRANALEHLGGNSKRGRTSQGAQGEAGAHQQEIGKEGGEEEEDEQGREGEEPGAAAKRARRSREERQAKTKTRPGAEEGGRQTGPAGGAKARGGGSAAAQKYGFGASALTFPMPEGASAFEEQGILMLAAAAAAASVCADNRGQDSVAAAHSLRDAFPHKTSADSQISLPVAPCPMPYFPTYSLTPSSPPRGGSGDGGVGGSSSNIDSHGGCIGGGGGGSDGGGAHSTALVSPGLVPSTTPVPVHPTLTSTSSAIVPSANSSASAASISSPVSALGHSSLSLSHPTQASSTPLDASQALPLVSNPSKTNSRAPPGESTTTPPQKAPKSSKPSGAKSQYQAELFAAENARLRREKAAMVQQREKERSAHAQQRDEMKRELARKIKEREDVKVERDAALVTVHEQRQRADTARAELKRLQDESRRIVGQFKGEKEKLEITIYNLRMDLEKALKLQMFNSARENYWSGRHRGDVSDPARLRELEGDCRTRNLRIVCNNFCAMAAWQQAHLSLCFPEDGIVLEEVAVRMRVEGKSADGEARVLNHEMHIQPVKTMRLQIAPSAPAPAPPAQLQPHVPAPSVPLQQPLSLPLPLPPLSSPPALPGVLEAPPTAAAAAAAAAAPASSLPTVLEAASSVNADGSVVSAEARASDDDGVVTIAPPPPALGSEVGAASSMPSSSAVTSCVVKRSGVGGGADSGLGASTGIFGGAMTSSAIGVACAAACSRAVDATAPAAPAATSHVSFDRVTSCLHFMLCPNPGEEDFKRKPKKKAG